MSGTSPLYEEGMELVKQLAAAMRDHMPPSKERHDMLNMLSNIGSRMLLIDGERQDAVDELAEARETFTTTLQQLMKQENARADGA